MIARCFKVVGAPRTHRYILEACKCRASQNLSEPGLPGLEISYDVVLLAGLLLPDLLTVKMT